MKTAAVTTPKGGVAKTTTAIHWADFLAREGFRTLLIDADDGDLSEVVPAPNDAGQYLTTGDIFKGNSRGLKPRLIAKNLAFVPADDELVDLHDLPMDLLVAMELELEKPGKTASIAAVRQIFSELQTRLTFPFTETLASFSDQFDVCIIDTAPYLARRTMAVLCACDAVLSPTNISAFTMRRIGKLAASLKYIRENHNPRLQHLGYLLSKINSKSPNEVEGVDEMRQEHGALVLDQVVIDRTSVSTSLSLGHPVWHNAVAGAQRQAARELRAACREATKRLGLTKGE